MNIRIPPRRLDSRLNVAAPRHMAKKKSFRSAPRIVSGRESERWTLLTRLASAMYSSGFLRGALAGKQPREEIHRRNCHANAEQHAGENAFRSTLAESERQTCHDNRHQ